MSVKTISKDDLRRMEGDEGMILQGCGGSLNEWVDGINDMLTEDGILLEGTRFHNCSTFEHDGVTCLLFPFKDDVKIDMSKLAMWRLQTHGYFGGTWLSDYVPNRLGGFTQARSEKPDCELLGHGDNFHYLAGIAAMTLIEAGQEDKAQELTNRVMCSDCADYDQAMRIIGEYVNITSVDNEPNERENFEEGLGMQL